jgi:hypothetical protein
MQGKRGCRRLVLLRRARKQRYRQLREGLRVLWLCLHEIWRWLGDEDAVNNALGRIARLTGFIVLVSLLLWHLVHQLEVICRIFFH